jgi:hypothetical protein
LIRVLQLEQVLGSLVLSERYTLQQLCELAADKDASFASRVLDRRGSPDAAFAHCGKNVR